MKCLSIRQPWAWLITHPDVLRVSGLPPKNLENRTWLTSYRGELFIHAGLAVEDGLFEFGQLRPDYWRRVFGDAGQALFAAMPKNVDDYDRGCLVGSVQFVDILCSSSSPWFLGPYAFVLASPRVLAPVKCRGQLKIFDVPSQGN